MALQLPVAQKGEVYLWALLQDQEGCPVATVFRQTLARLQKAILLSDVFLESVC